MKTTSNMVMRFLSWPLPRDFAPDGGVSFTPMNHPTAWPVGTNLLTAAQAQQMLEHVLADDASASGGLAPHQQRVVAEAVELRERLGKLLSFFQSPIFAGLPEAERSRLRNQARFMDGYAAVLEERIEAFGAR